MHRVRNGVGCEFSDRIIVGCDVMNRYMRLALVLTMTSTASVVHAEVSKVVTVDNDHVRVWNKFANDLVSLHQQLTKNKNVKQTERTGGYASQPDFYKEEVFSDSTSGRVISKLLWEKAKPANLHVVEVYVYNDKGQVIRDYSASYLPHGRNAPVQTLINLHGYSGKMHGFRQFDATGDIIFEQCEGTYKGKNVTIRLFENDLFGNSKYADAIVASDAYKACFQGIERNAKRYIVNPS